MALERLSVVRSEFCAIAAAMLLVVAVRGATAQDYPPLTPQREYNGIVAGEEAYQANEARRRAEIDRQAGLNADMFWRWSGSASWWPGAFEPWPVVPGDVWGYPAATIVTPRPLPIPLARRPGRVVMPRPPLAIGVPVIAPQPPAPGPSPEPTPRVGRPLGPREF